MECDRINSTPSNGFDDGSQNFRPLHGRTSGPTRRSTKGQWTPEEDEILRQAVHRFKGKNWKKIAECFKDRTDVQCLHRWQKVLNPELVKGPWSKEEDERIIELVNKYGPKKWSNISQHLPGRIGKQCRERWHNHLNPAINKEAWTQEEELALIRAHQIYGNKWAELSKFLPGRTDNAIKNHWNSSVKKKLDSYLASGLLNEFPAVSDVGHQNISMPSSSSRMQSSGDNNGPKAATEADEFSECSQNSTIAGFSHAIRDVANAARPSREEVQLADESNLGPSSSVSCAEQFTSLGDVKFSITEPCGVVYSSDTFEQNVRNKDSASDEDQFTLHELANNSLQLGEGSKGLQTYCTGARDSHEVADASFQTSMGMNASLFVGNMVMASDQSELMLISDEECCRILFSEAMIDECFSNPLNGSNMVDMSRNSDSLLCQPSNVQISETGRTLASQSHCQSFLSAAAVLSDDCDTFIYGGEPNQLLDTSSRIPEQEYGSSLPAGFIYTHGTANSDCDKDKAYINVQEQPDLAIDSTKLVPVNTFGSGSEILQTCHSVDEKPDKKIEQETGALCYEPPHFPSLDVPFFSCDLIQSSSDTQQEYSPLGIRQLMMSSMNCISPLRLWDSPSEDDSPDAVLKIAAKTFSGTPSILKKRHRELLSPLSDRRRDKKHETTMTSNLAREVSHLDVILDENCKGRLSSPTPSSSQKRNSGAFTEDIENFSCSLREGQEKECDNTAIFYDIVPENSFHSNNSLDKIKEGTVVMEAKTKDGVDAALQVVQQPSILNEHNMNDLQSGFKTDPAFRPTFRTPRNLHKSSNPRLNQGVLSGSSHAHTCLSFLCSPTVCRRKNESYSVPVTSLPSASSSAPAENTVDNAGNENLSIETPVKISIESPSAWVSPWFLNSFLPGPRVDTDITTEDIDYLVSPGSRSYDAIGLMKQLNEHTAAAYADALEVLGNGTPKTLLRDIDLSIQKRDQQNDDKHSHLASDVMERRVLDFSECGTPGKRKEKASSSKSITFSSPSSYLLKHCR